MFFNEEVGDLFALDNDCHFVHCISADHKMGAGIAVPFAKKFNLHKYFNSEFGKDTLLSIGRAYKVGNSFSLVTKSRYWEKPTYESFQTTLEDLKRQCLENEISKLAMPRLGCGLDRLNWIIVKGIIKSVFADADIEIQVRSL